MQAWGLSCAAAGLTTAGSVSPVCWVRPLLLREGVVLVVPQASVSL